MIYCVEDDKNVRDLILYALKNNDIECCGFDSAAPFYRALEEKLPDLVLLDLMLPDVDGYTILQRLKSDDDTMGIPVIILSAKTEEYDRIFGLESGADDYIVKPFSVLEVVSRIRAVLRRSGMSKRKELRVGDLRMDVDTRRVFVGENEVRLTNREYQLLQYLMENQGVPVGRDILLNRVWGYEFQGETRTVDVHIRFLRQKLGNAGKCIETVRGMGYRID
ncbi:MAG: response regulator transcription factor [Firmicutes bacterium]|nr:response regulator transcription factor [Bacillota bacterium]MBQ4093023.1 response regulator transcription factor [Bacillota bacterium]MBQ6811129.1 response regulator transcription factor [Bacillota bacterium]